MQKGSGSWHPNTLEASDASGTYEFQAALPRLPVPPVAQSIKQYLHSVSHLMAPHEMERTRAVAEAFASEEVCGPLQQFLLERKAACDGGATAAQEAAAGNGAALGAPSGRAAPDASDADASYPSSHWLEQWMETLAYHSDPSPLPVNINVWGTMYNGATHAQPLLNLVFVAQGMLAFRARLQEGTVPPDRIGRKPMCMWQYRRQFATTRLPGTAASGGVDTLHCAEGRSRHIAVSAGSAWFKVEVLDEQGGLVPTHVVEAAFAECWRQGTVAVADAAAVAAAAAATSDGTPAVGLLTSLPRPAWAEARAMLLAEGPANASSLAAIEDALFVAVLALDVLPEHGDDVMRKAMAGVAGRGDMWFDKSMAITVYGNGRVCFQFEHSCSDAVVPARTGLEASLWAKEAEKKYIAPPAAAIGAEGARALAQPLPFALSAPLRAQIAAARERLALAVDRVQLRTFYTELAGVSAIKKARFGPDSFMQMALQLAFVRDQGAAPVTYETATMRLFLHGRTETIRSSSPESAAFVAAMGAWVADAADAGKAAAAAKALAAGVGAHQKYTLQCMAGNGLDRHLLGLRMAAAEMGVALPAEADIFADPAYARSTSFTLSTSQMSVFEDVEGRPAYPAFGPPVPGSYGVCYNMSAGSIAATIVCGDAPGTAPPAGYVGGARPKDAARFAKHLEGALRDMMALVAAVQKAKGSKL